MRQGESSYREGRLAGAVAESYSQPVGIWRGRSQGNKKLMSALPFPQPSLSDLLISSICPNKVPQTWWLKQQTFFIS